MSLTAHDREIGPQPTADRPRVLVVDDDDRVRTVVRWQLDAAGFEVVEAADGVAALAAITDHDPRLVVLDLALPGLGGLDVIRAVRGGRAGTDVDRAIIVLSGRDGETDRIVGLDLGADDYLVKPFSPGELAARVRSVLRRAPGSPPLLHAGSLTIDTGTHEVLCRGDRVELTAKEFDLLVYLVRHPRQVFTRPQLLEHVWRSSPAWLSEATVTEHVHRLRGKLEQDPAAPRLLRTRRGVGYQLDPEA